MAWSFLDILFKSRFGRRSTSADKRPYEEFSDSTIDVHATEVKAEAIHSTPAQGIADGVAQLYTLHTLTEDITVGGHQSWYAFQTPNRLKNWISDKYGAGYAIKLYDNNDVQIYPTDASDWIFDYPTGILNFSGDVSAYARPFKITGYQYVGAFMNTFAVNGKLQKQIIPITSNGQVAFDLAVELPQSFSEIFEVKVNGLPLKSTEWSVLANILTFADGVAQFQLSVSDEFEVQYYAE